MVNKAFSLVELLVVSTVMLVLAGLIYPILSKSKESSMKAVDVMHAKQLSIGMEIYRESNNGCPPILSNFYRGHPNKILFASNRDFTAEGYANHIGKKNVQGGDPASMYGRFETKVSYLGADAVGLTDDVCLLEPGSAWAILQERLDYNSPPYDPKGRYHRLNNDTSIKFVKAPAKQTPDGGLTLQVKDVYCPNKSN